MLKHIEPHRGHKTIIDAAAALLDRLEPITPPRSLCEIRLREVDYQWLLEWGKNVSEWLLKDWLSGSPLGSAALKPHATPMEAIGLLLLTFSAEVARREAPIHGLWSIVESRFGQSARNILFSQGNPSDLFKDAIRAAAIGLGLRHAFNEDEVHWYYDTVHLQIGWTQKGIAKLSQWLVGIEAPKAVQLLRHSNMKSSSFSLLWQQLSNFRSNNITEKRLRAYIDSSPWVLPGWGDQLVLHAKDVVANDPSYSTRMGKDDSEASIIDAVHLKWQHPQRPSFIGKITNLAVLELSAPKYELCVDGRPKITLLRQPDESYDYETELQLSTDNPEPIISLRDDTGFPIVVSQVTLWSPDDEITLFEMPSGRRIDAWIDEIKPERSYVLIASADLEVTPTPSVWMMLESGSSIAYLLPSNWPTDLQVRLDGKALWNPIVSGTPASRDQSLLADMFVTTSPLDDHCVAVGVHGLPSKAEVEFLGIGRQAVDFERTPSMTRSRPLYLSPEVEGKRLPVVIGVRLESKTVRVRQLKSLCTRGMSRLRGHGWSWVTPQESITITGTDTLFRFHQMDWYWLAEGRALLGKVPSRPDQLRSLIGYGAPLQVIDTPFNALETPKILAKEVLDIGAITDVSYSNTKLRISLNRPLELGPDYTVVLWEPGSPPMIYSYDKINNTDDEHWDVCHPGPSIQKAVVGVAFRGRRLGTWVGSGVLGALPEIPKLTPTKRCQQGACMRWFHLPLLKSDWIRQIRQLAINHPVEFLSAWLMESGLPRGLAFDSKRDKWLAVIREIYWKWNPPKKVAQEILALYDGAREAATVACAESVIHVDPILMARIIRPNCNPKAMNDLIRRIIGSPKGHPDIEFRKRQDEILSEAAQSMHVDDHFIKDGICRQSERVLDGQQLTPLNESNIRWALSFEPARRYMGIHLLKWCGMTDGGK